MNYIRRKPWRSAILASTILVSGLSAPAWGQAQPLGTPQVRSPTDGNGVNRANGSIELAIPEISIGDPERGGLVHTRYWIAQNWKHGYQIYIKGNAYLGYTVVLGNQSRTYPSGFGSPADSAQGDGSTLVVNATNAVLTERDGTTITFDRTMFTGFDTFEDQLYPDNPIAAATDIARPTGEKIKLTYKVTPSTYGNAVILQSVTNNHGYQLKYEHDGAGKLSQVMAINNAVDYCDPAANTCTGLTQTWPKVTYARSVVGSVATETATDLLNRVTRYTFDIVGPTSLYRLKGIKRPSSSTDNLTYTYGAGTLSVSNGVDTWNYGFSSSGGFTNFTVTNPLGQTESTTTDSNTMQIVSTTDGLGRITSLSQDSFGRITQQIFPEGNKAQYTYDARGNVTQTRQISKTPGTPADIVTSSAYSASCANTVTCNRPTSTTDAKGFVTDYTYDGTHGGLLTVTQPAPTGSATRPQTRYAYGTAQAYYKNSGGSIVASGQPIYLQTGTSACQTGSSCAGTSDEVKTSIAYGPQTAGTANNLLPVSASEGSGDGTLTATSAFTYDSVGNRLTVDGPLSGSADTMRTRYDATRQVVGVVGPDPDGGGSRIPVAQRLTYNSDGQVTLAEIGTVADQSDTAWASFSTSQQAATTYDANARPVKQELKSGGTTYALTQTKYDALGRVSCTAQRMDPSAWASQTDACIPQTTGSYGPDRIAKTNYNAASEVISIQTAYGTPDQATEVTNAYNGNGTLQSVKDGENNLTTYEYDGFDRLLKTRYPSSTQGAGTSSTTDYEQLTYDANGNVTQRRLRNGTTFGFSYDNLDRVTLKDLPGTGLDLDVNYSYDLLGRLTSSTEPNNHNATFTYDALSRVLSEAGAYGGTKTFQYDLVGRRTRMTWPDGLYIAYDYDIAGNATAIRENGASSGTGVLATYAYDNLGRRTGVTRGNGTTSSYSYDAVSRLTSLSHDLAGASYDLTIGSFAYNPASQMTSLSRSNDAYAWGGHYNEDRSATLNGLNQQTGIANATTSTNVSLAHDTLGNVTGIGSASFGYSQQNLLYYMPGVSGYMYYDVLGRRDYSTLGAPSGTQYLFDYEGDRLIGELTPGTPTHTPLRRYVYGPGTDEPIVWYEGSGTSDRRWLHSDERGSVIAVTDGSGAVLGVNSYDPYGKPAAGNIGRFGYTGQAWLPELGMWSYKARIYNPANNVGRFMQSDPIGYEGGMNLYAYVSGDPVNLTDPLGLSEGDTNNGPSQVDIVVNALRFESGVFNSFTPNPAAGVATVAFGSGVTLGFDAANATPSKGTRGGKPGKPEKPRSKPKTKPEPDPEKSGICAYADFQEAVGEAETDGSGIVGLTNHLRTGGILFLTGLKDKYIARLIKKINGCPK